MTDTALYAEMQDVAQELLDEFGQPVTLIIEGSVGGGYDADGNPQGAIADVAVTGVGAALDYKRDEIDGTVIQSGDCKLLYKGGAPVIGMTVTLSSIKWRVVALLPLDPAGILVMYELQLRK